MYLLTVTCFEDGESCGTLAEGLYTTEANAIHALADWCKSAWLDQEHEDEDGDGQDKLSGTDAEIVEHYFDFWTPEEVYDLTEMVPDAPLPGTEF